MLWDNAKDLTPRTGHLVPRFGDLDLSKQILPGPYDLHDLACVARENTFLDDLRWDMFSWVASVLHRFRTAIS